MDQFNNLSGMGQDDAKRYILAHITDLNLLRQQIKQKSAELDTWKSRIALAESKSMPELMAAAQAQAASLGQSLDGLMAEERALAGDIATMKSQLPGLGARERRIDADQLEVELQMATGEFDQSGQAGVEKEVKSAEADQALADLKASMGMAPPAAQENERKDGTP